MMINTTSKTWTMVRMTLKVDDSLVPIISRPVSTIHMPKAHLVQKRGGKGRHSSSAGTHSGQQCTLADVTRAVSVQGSGAGAGLRLVQAEDDIQKGCAPDTVLT